MIHKFLINVPINVVFTDTLYIHPSQHSISMITGLQTALNAKQGTLTAGTNITISGNTISSTGSSGATQAWVSANFLSPLNQGTVGVGPGLSASMTANTFLISVDQNFDRRNLFILQDANNVLRNITTNTSGNLLYDNVNLATEPYVTNALNNLTSSNFKPSNVQPYGGITTGANDSAGTLQLGIDTNTIATVSAVNTVVNTLGASIALKQDILNGVSQKIYLVYPTHMPPHTSQPVSADG